MGTAVLDSIPKDIMTQALFERESQEPLITRANIFMADSNKLVERVIIADFYQSMNEIEKKSVKLPTDTTNMNFKINSLSFDKSALHTRYNAMLQDPKYQNWKEQKLKREQWEASKQNAIDTDFEEEIAENVPTKEKNKL